jgi:hypothetical protein
LSLTKKGKTTTKTSSSWGQNSKGEKRKDLRKVKCFACQKLGHFSIQRPNKKKGNEKSQMEASTSKKVDDFAA